MKAKKTTRVAKKNQVKKPEKKYKIELTQRQMYALSIATEIFSRIGIGQLRRAIEFLPLEEKHYMGNFWHKDMEIVEAIVSRYTKQNVDGWRSSLGIHGSGVSDDAKICYDIHQVIRHKLSWVRAVEEGYVESEKSPRNFKEMFGVNYDEPLACSQEPLVKIEALEQAEHAM